VFQYQTRRYFELILGIYFLVLGCVAPMVMLPKSGHPLALHYIFELLLVVIATFFLVRSTRVVTVVVVDMPQQKS